MILELLLALVIGIFIGTLTGLAPGIHINLVSTFLISSLSFFLLHFSPMSLAVFIVSLSISHTITDFIPGIYLGAPDDSSGLSVLPGHKFLLEGKGHQAFLFTLQGIWLSLPLLLLLLPVFLFVLPKIYLYLKFVMFLVLVSISLYSLVRDKFLLSCFIFILAGFLGITSMNLPLQDSLLPLLSGLFGSSSLISSLAKQQKIPQQEISTLKSSRLSKEEIKTTLFSSLVSAPLCSFLPALGGSQAAILGSDMNTEMSQKEFLSLLGAISILVLSLSFVTLFSIQASRTGSAVAIENILPKFSFSNLSVLLAVVLVSTLFSSFISIQVSKFFSQSINKISYTKISIAVLAILTLAVILFSGILGFLLFLVSTFTGLVCILLSVRRTHLMGSLMIPTILFYLPF